MMRYGLLCCMYLFSFLGGVVAQSSPGFSDADWPWWRGPQRDGNAASRQTLPLAWSETEKVLWKTPIPGRGHGSPTLVGQRIFLATADEEVGTQSVLCLDRNTGKQLWQTVVFTDGFVIKRHNKKSSYASSTVACDGERIFVNFYNGDAVHTIALTVTGKECWRTKISDYTIHQGYASSPTIYKSLVIASADNKGGGAVVGMNRETGEIVWQQSRPAKPNYTSPVIFRAKGRDQLFLVGANRVSSYDPLSGEKNWDIAGATTECVSSPVTDGERLFIAGGTPKAFIAALQTDGSGMIDWECRERLYVPSMLIHGDYLYAVTDKGYALCRNTTSGQEQWKERLSGSFSASIVRVEQHILAINEKGGVFIFEANPQAYKPVTQTQLGDEAMATPAVCSSRIYVRVAHNQEGKRQEMLYCIGEQ